MLARHGCVEYSFPRPLDTGMTNRGLPAENQSSYVRVGPGSLPWWRTLLRDFGFFALVCFVRSDVTCAEDVVASIHGS